MTSYGEAKATELVGTPQGAGADAEYSAGGDTEIRQEDNKEANSLGDDASGESTSGSASSGDTGQSAEQVGDSGGIETYEGVSASDFASYSEMVEVRLDALVASSVVLVVAVFVACGALVVQTLIRSLERW